VTAVRVLSGTLGDEQRREFVYSGDLLVFQKIRPIEEYCVFTISLIREVFGTTDPVIAQFEFDRDEYLSRVEALQKRFRNEARAQDLFLAALGHAGVDLRRTFWDWLYLRVSPHCKQYSGRRTARLGFHRDTWSSNVYAQTNCWAPIYPISPGRTIAFYGEYWEKPLKITSAVRDLEEIRSGRSSTPLVSEPSEPVDAGDVADDYGAPNVDGEAPRVDKDWFRHVDDGTPPTAVVARG
jgi:hypothetical protein